MALPERLKFGIFMAPFHRLNENPTLALERDLELVQWLDTLGFDEVWVGEHHSAGWETISCPEIFIGIAADRGLIAAAGFDGMITSLQAFFVGSRIVRWSDENSCRPYTGPFGLTSGLRLSLAMTS